MEKKVIEMNNALIAPQPGRREGLKIFGILCALLLQGDLALGQTELEASNAIQFNLVMPGARSLALGGAFLARADDATAAYTNPAGLTNLSIPEFSIETRSWAFSHSFVDSGRLECGAQCEPKNRGVDVISGLQMSESRSEVNGIPFLSYVYSGKKAFKRWRLAFYRHELANFEAGYRTQGAFRNGGRGRTHPTDVQADLDIVNHGISAAVALGDALAPRLSLGLGLSYYDFSLDSVVRRYFFDNKGDLDDLLGVGQLFGPPDYSSDNVAASNVQVGESSDLGFNFGFLWRLNDIINIAGVYRQGPDFALLFRLEPGIAERSTFKLRASTFQVPDIYGLGISVAATSRLKIAFDYNRVEYSQLTRNSRPGFIADDAGEAHLGFEYDFLPGLRPLSAVRLGAWYDPDHRTRFEFPCEEIEDFTMKAGCYYDLTLYPRGEDEMHYTGGVGMMFGAVEVNLGFDLSERIDTVAVSMVYRP